MLKLRPHFSFAFSPYSIPIERIANERENQVLKLIYQNACDCNTRIFHNFFFFFHFSFSRSIACAMFFRKNQRTQSRNRKRERKKNFFGIVLIFGCFFSPGFSDLMRLVWLNRAVKCQMSI